MRKKIKMKKNAIQNEEPSIAPVDVVSIPQILTSDKPLNVQVAEFLSEADKTLLDTAKLKLELASANTKTAVAQNESARLAHSNVVLQLAMRYRLVDGDLITEDGEIKRKVRG
jgi:hypothetical protein